MLVISHNGVLKRTLGWGDLPPCCMPSRIDAPVHCMRCERALD